MAKVKESKWLVTKAGSGTRTVDHIELHESGALKLINVLRGSSEVVGFFGPGMWVSAEKIEVEYT